MGIGTFHTMPTRNFDDETALSLSFAILDGDIASVDGCVFLSGWVNDPTLEDGKKCLDV
jgi:hypothetical protein